MVNFRLSMNLKNQGANNTNHDIQMPEGPTPQGYDNNIFTGPFENGIAGMHTPSNSPCIIQTITSETILLQSPNTYHSATGASVNSSGQIVGAVYDANLNPSPVYWYSSMKMPTVLKTGNYSYGMATGINSSGQIVGILSNNFNSLDGNIPVYWASVIQNPILLNTTITNANYFCVNISSSGLISASYFNETSANSFYWPTYIDQPSLVNNGIYFSPTITSMNSYGQLTGTILDANNNILPAYWASPTTVPSVLNTNGIKHIFPFNITSAGMIYAYDLSSSTNLTLELFKTSSLYLYFSSSLNSPLLTSSLVNFNLNLLSLKYFILSITAQVTHNQPISYPRHAAGDMHEHEPEPVAIYQPAPLAMPAPVAMPVAMPAPVARLCPPCKGGIFMNQADLDELIGCTEIDGDVHIMNFDGQPDFRVFDSVEIIEGYLNIENNDDLEMINGFNKLKSITGSLIISNNLNLLSIKGFSKLTDIVGSGIGSIYEVYTSSLAPGSFMIMENPSLQNIINFTALANVGGTFNLEKNDSLKKINMPLLEYIGQDFTIKDNDSLVSIDKFPTLKDINGDFIITGNSSLVTIKDFNLNQINRDFIITNNNLNTTAVINSFNRILGSVDVTARLDLSSFNILQTAYNNIPPRSYKLINMNPTAAPGAG